MQSERERAVDLAWRAIGARERTTHELRSYLEGKRVEPAAIEEACEALREAGFLDDADYARRFTEDRRVVQRWGSERIARELHRRGVASALVEQALADTGGGEELDTALDILGERLPSPPEDDRGRDRAWRMLVGKGYSSELAYEAVRRHGREAA